MIMGRVTYLHHYLPTLWFAVLIAGHVLDTWFFNNQKLSPTTRLAWFVLWTAAVVINFWWFKDLALGIHGPVNDHKGWQWRRSWNVSGVQGVFADIRSTTACKPISCDGQDAIDP